MGTAYIVDAVRTPRAGMGKQGGALHPTRSSCSPRRSAASRSASPSTPPTSRTWSRGACSRSASKAPASPGTRSCSPDGRTVVTGVTLNRFCGSGLQAVNFALMGVASGHAGSWSSAAASRSMSRVPMGLGRRWPHGKNVDLLEARADRPAGHLRRT